MYQIAWVGRSLVLSLFLLGCGALGAIAEPSIQNINQNPIQSQLANSEVANSETLLQDEDIPEEVLRAEIYAEARSPKDGKLLSAAEYIELNQLLRESIDNIPPRFLVSDKLQRLIDLLKLRKLIRQVIPFF